MTAEATRQALKTLKPYEGAIRGLADRQPPIHFVGTTWRSWLEEAGWQDPEIDRVLDEFPDSFVDRADLGALAQGATDARGRRRLLVATLIWGRGKRNGRMRDHIVGALRNEKLDEVLEQTAELAVEDPSAAYRAWKVKGLGEAFFTKWLWAASRTDPSVNCCLTLDARVWSSLNGALGWYSREAAGTRSRADRYAAYVDACHYWAGELQGPATAEDVECALFEANGDLSNLATWVSPAR